MNEMDFLTPEEREQMEAFMEKAAERMRKKTTEDSTHESCHFLFLHYQQECREQIERKRREQQAAFEHDISALLNQLCFFCQKYGIPACKNADECKRDNDFSELPF